MKRFIDGLDEDARIILSIVITIWMICGALAGAVETIDRRSENFSGCLYTSLASFTPSRVLVCEIGRKRFQVGGEK